MENKLKKVIIISGHFINDLFTSSYGYGKIKFIAFTITIFLLNLSLLMPEKSTFFDRLTIRTIFSIFFAAILFSCYSLLKHSIADDNFIEIFSIAAFVIMFPFILALGIEVVENKIGFDLAQFSMKEWPAIFAGILTYYGTTGLGLLTIYRKQRPAPTTASIPYFPQVKADDRCTFQIKRKKTVKQQSHSLSVKLKNAEITSRQVRIRIRFTNISKTSINSICVTSFLCNLYFKNFNCEHFSVFEANTCEAVMTNCAFYLDTCIEISAAQANLDILSFDLCFHLEYRDPCFNCSSQYFHIKSNFCGIPINNLYTVECLIN